MKKFRYYLEYLFLSGLGVIIRLLPRKIVLFMGERAGDFIFYCIPIRKKLTIAHLTRSFPQKTQREISGIARRAYQNLAINCFEHLCLPGLSKEDLGSIVRLENDEIMQRAFARKKGIIFVGGHFGNWEYPGSTVSLMGYPVNYVVADLGNPYVDKMVNKHRKETGVGILQKGMAVRGTLATLRNNGGVAMLMDQDAGRSGVLVDFFNKPCSTPKGPALFALKTGAAVIFISSIRQKDGTLRIVFEDVEIDYSQGPTEENIFDVMQRCTARLESYIRKYPDHWFWMHRRWKTRPDQVEH